MKKNWIKRRQESTMRFLSALGLKSLHELTGCTLAIYVSYGNEDGGWSAFAKPRQISIGERTLEIMFDEPFVEIVLDATTEGLGGDFKKYKPGFDFVITNLTFDGKRWSATTLERGAAGQISENLDVEIIRP